jgi:homoserine O-acetyltransferase/O-succinyltransferase
MPASTPSDHHQPPVTPTPDFLVTKQVFELARYTTTGGATIRHVRVGWESSGTLNKARDNAILVTHFFSGNSHAAGKYHLDEAEPGYWNAIIGPGKPLDTNRYCIISSDTLVNLNAKDPNTITTGPATIDPATGKPYGMSFPIVTIRDFVNVQNALLDHLGITSLQAVVGASMGALQALEWGSAYPDRVQRVIAVIGGAEENAFLIGWLELWAAPIRLDPDWNQGDYYGRAEPTRGLVEALKIVTLQASQWPWIDRMFGRAWADEGKDPRAALEHRFAVENWLERTAADRAAVCDANHFLYLVKANQLFLIGHGSSVEAGLQAIKAPVLLIASADDLVFPPQRHLRTLKDELAAMGKEVTYTEVITTDLGHLDGIAYIAKAGDDIAGFLAQSVTAKPPGSRT